MANEKIDEVVAQVAAAPMFDLLVRWSPTGRIEVAWPPIDDVAKLGMLEMAKLVLIEGRAKAHEGRGLPMIIPATRIKQE